MALYGHVEYSVARRAACRESVRHPNAISETPPPVRERQVYLQPDGLDSNTYNTYNINIIKYLQYGRHTGTTNICLLPIVQSPWY